MNRFKRLFNNKISTIGMIHLRALPGTPKYDGSLQKIIDTALKETEIYLKHNIDGLLIENMHDIPYVQSKRFKPETVAVMTRITTEIKKIIGQNMPCGIQVLACGNKEALAIAKACHLSFVRVEGFVFSHVADEGFTDACAGDILRYRKEIDAENVLIFSDIKKKHSSHSITSDVSLIETAKAAEFFLSDGVILTGTSTGAPADKIELDHLKDNLKIPVLIGSGITDANFHEYKRADGVIVGSYYKKDGLWFNEIDEERLKRFCLSL
nr:uncharacterized protein F13E9.13, mitochondrial-like [Onthophagus taurus]XP_022908356.1 uncharacterized protein F13E9.13, mitochondrial-like [Onthophagus taurus]